MIWRCLVRLCCTCTYTFIMIVSVARMASKSKSPPETSLSIAASLPREGLMELVGGKRMRTPRPRPAVAFAMATQSFVGNLCRDNWSEESHVSCIAMTSGSLFARVRAASLLSILVLDRMPAAFQLLMCMLFC